MPVEATEQLGYTVGKRRAFTIRNGQVVFGAYLQDLAFYDDDLEQAAADIGSTDTILTIAEPAILPNNLDLSTTGITLKFVNNGSIEVLATKILVVGAMQNPGNKQVFVGAGTVRYANGSVQCVNTAWRAGNSNTADVTLAISEALASFDLYGGICGIYLPQLSPETDGGHETTSACYLFGNGNFSSGSNGYGNTLRMKAGSTEDYMFKIGEGKYSIRFANIVLDANGVTGKTAVLAEGSEGAGLTSADVSFRHVTFDSFNYGFNHNSVSGAFQLAQTIFDTCIFQGCNTSVRTNSVNAGLTFINTNLALPLNGVGYQCDGGGLVNFFGGEIGGNPVTKTFVDANVNTTTNRITFASAHGFTNNSACFVTTTGTRPVSTPAMQRTLYIKVISSTVIELSDTPGGTSLDITSAAGGGTHTVWQVTAKFMVVTGSHGAINFVGVQDEGLLSLVENDADDINGMINFSHGCLMQSKVLLNESCQVNITDCNIFAHAVQGDADLAYVSIINPNFRAFSVDDNQTVATAATDVGVGVVVHTERIPTKNHFIQRVPQTFYSPKAYDGNPTVPVATFGHYTEISESKPLAWFGRTDAQGNRLYGYAIRRNYSTGRAEWFGDQAGYRGMDFQNMNVTANNVKGGVVSPAQITANQNNYVPDATNVDQQVETFRLSTDASRNITGLGIGQTANDHHFIVNVGSFDIVLKHQDTNSTAANRFLCSTGSDITLAAGEAAFLAYDDVTARWRVYKLGAGASGGGGTWGSITGTLASQTDLATALDAKADIAGDSFTGTINVAGRVQLSGGGNYFGIGDSQFGDVLGTGVTTIQFPSSNGLVKRDNAGNREYMTAGASVASASTITPTGYVFHVTGTSAISTINATIGGYNMIVGARILMIFDSTATVNNGSTIKLAGGANFSATANDVLELVWDGSAWYQVSNSVN